MRNFSDIWESSLGGVKISPPPYRIGLNMSQKCKNHEYVTENFTLYWKSEVIDKRQYLLVFQIRDTYERNLQA